MGKRRPTRRYGDGTIYQLKNGKWRGEIPLDGKRSYRTRDTAEAVADALDELKRAYNDGLPIGDDVLTVGKLLDEWLVREVAPKVEVGERSPNTLDNKRWAIEKHLAPRTARADGSVTYKDLGARKLRDLRKLDVEHFLTKKVNAGLSKSSVTRFRAILTEALTWAEDRDLVKRNVASKAAIHAREPDRKRALTSEQAHALLDAAKGTDLEEFWTTALYLGLRPGEVSGLAWSDLDLGAGTLTVTRSLKRERQTLRLGEPKTRKSRRPLALPPDLIAVLRAHKHDQRLAQIAAGPRWRPLTHNGQAVDLVFCTETGRPLDPSNVRRAFSKLVEAAGIEGHWHPNQLRTTATTFLLDAGVPKDHVADVLGHTSTRNIDRNYDARESVIEAGLVLGKVLAAK